jgi:hypothetical protein
MEKYFVIIIPPNVTSEITKLDFDVLVSSKEDLILLTGIEEKFDVLLSNYAEFEQELLSLTLYNLIHRDLDWLKLRSDVQLINQRLSNLLSSARLYLDQVKHDLSRGFGGKSSSIYQQAVEKISSEYDSNFSYQVMEAIRNFTQHRSLPVEGISYPMVRDESGSEVGTKFQIIPILAVNELKKDRGIKKELIEYLEKQKDDKNIVNIVPFVRGYIESFGRIHDRIRGLTGHSAVFAERMIQDFLLPLREKYPGSAISIRLQEGKKILREEYIFENLFERREKFLWKNQLLHFLSTRYVTGDCRSYKAEQDFGDRTSSDSD